MWTQLTLGITPRLHAVQARALDRRVDQGWQTQARCADVDPEAFFPLPSVAVERLTELAPMCLACPVRRSCLAAALLGDEAGLWAGTSEAQRATGINRLNAGGRVDDVLDRLLTDLARADKGAA